MESSPTIVSRPNPSLSQEGSYISRDSKQWLHDLALRFQQEIMDYGTLRGENADLLIKNARGLLADIKTLSPRKASRWNTYLRRAAREGKIPGERKSRSEGYGAKWASEQYKILQSLKDTNQEKRAEWQAYEVPSDDENHPAILHRFKAVPIPEYASPEVKEFSLRRENKLIVRAKRRLMKSLKERVEEADDLRLQMLVWVVDPRLFELGALPDIQGTGAVLHTDGAAQYDKALNEAGIGIETFAAMATGATTIADIRMSSAFKGFVKSNEDMARLIARHDASTVTVPSAIAMSSDSNEHLVPQDMMTAVHVSRETLQLETAVVGSEGLESSTATLPSPPNTPTRKLTTQDAQRMDFNNAIQKLLSPRGAHPGTLPPHGRKLDEYMRRHGLELVISSPSHGITQRDITHRSEWSKRAGAKDKREKILSLINAGVVYVRQRSQSPSPDSRVWDRRA